jgi:hypothetical protein
VFYLHHRVLLAISQAAFEPILSAPLSHPASRKKVIYIPETSTVLSIILHVMYGKSFTHDAPTLEALLTAVTQMPRYGISPKAHITPESPMHDLLLSFAPRYPFDIYTLAAQFDLYDLAVPTSAYLLSSSLINISDGMAERMGPIYLNRLLALHLNRFEAMKNILLFPPHPHSPSQECGFDEQKLLKNAWGLAAGCLAWDSRPGW